MAKKVLICVSQHGFWAEELLEPVRHLDAAKIGYEFIVNKAGRIPFPDEASLDPTYVDPPLGRPVTSQEMARRAAEEDWGKWFADAKVLEDLFPVRPYLSAPNYLAALETYYEDRQNAWRLVDGYDALLLVGGSGPVVDMVNNPRLHDLILGFYYADKPIAAECYTVTCLAFAREFDDRKCILAGRHVTGHTMEYDYTTGWALKANGDWLVYDAPPYPLEYILRDAVGPEGQFHGNVGRELSVIV
ncbi:MAG TPA: type 1 glutamine amidotransferase domain-containing protein, partial [Candidatus Omnitrophota bacterium]|nr:type 1 glutamine amidotransferase domain-containing protein [Candidatus Omnitrophota bacterium]